MSLLRKSSNLCAGTALLLPMVFQAYNSHWLILRVSPTVGIALPQTDEKSYFPQREGVRVCLCVCVYVSQKFH